MPTDPRASARLATVYTNDGLDTLLNHTALSQFEMLQAASRRIALVFDKRDPFPIAQFNSHLAEAAVWLCEPGASPSTVGAARTRIIEFMIEQACRA
jgi:hypothetical protein